MISRRAKLTIVFPLFFYLILLSLATYIFSLEITNQYYLYIIASLFGTISFQMARILADAPCDSQAQLFFDLAPKIVLILILSFLVFGYAIFQAYDGNWLSFTILIISYIITWVIAYHFNKIIDDENES